jgi:hypothetical protein
MKSSPDAWVAGAVDAFVMREDDVRDRRAEVDIGGSLPLLCVRAHQRDLLLGERRRLCQYRSQD